MSGTQGRSRRREQLAAPLPGGVLHERCYCQRLTLPYVHTLEECLRQRVREQALSDFAESERVR